MTRIPGVDYKRLPDDLRRPIEMQVRKTGRPYGGHVLYARREPIYRAARQMWAALEESGLLDPRLVALLNRRVAAINGCEF